MPHDFETVSEGFAGSGVFGVDARKQPFILFSTGARILICDPRGEEGRGGRFCARAGEELLELSCASGNGRAAMQLNYLENSDFADGLACWELEGPRQPRDMLGVDLSPEWTLAGVKTAYARFDKRTKAARILYRDPDFGPFMPVAPGRNYAVGGRFGLHRCEASLDVEFCGAAHDLIETVETRLDPAYAGGAHLNGYHSAWRVTPAPRGAAFARLVVSYRGARANGATDLESYVFMAQLFFGPSQPHAPGRWTPRRLGLQKALRLDPDVALIEARLPSALLKGRLKHISVLDAETHRELEGSPVELPRLEAVSGSLARLDGFTLRGSLVCGGDGPVDLDLVIDGRVAATSTSSNPDPQGARSFSFQIPPAYCDGRARHLQAQTSVGGALVAQSLEIIPNALTSWSALQEHAGSPMPHHLDPNAARRHRCVLAKIEALARRARAGEDVVAELELVGTVNEILALGFKANKRFPPLAFPDCASPQASIVIPAHDKFETTYHCLAALWLAECAASYEIILVDDGSTDRTREIGGLVSGLRILRNERPLGFVRACNLGAAEARGDYIVLLNNDTEPDGKWLDELIFALRQFPGAGMAGAKLVYPDGELQEAGGIVWRNGNPWNYGRRGNASDPRYNYARQADYLSGAAIMLPAEAWRRVGGFSEEFAPAYFEDTDLAFKLRQIGLKTIYAPLARVVHHEGVSNGVSVSSGMKRHQEINRPKFKRKWAQAFRFSREEGDEPDLAKDRGVTARALVVDISTPRPDIDAGSYAAIQEMRLLQSLGLKATFAPENMAYLGKYTEALQRIGVETIHAPFAFSVREVLEARGAEFDIVYVTRYDLARRLMDDIRRLAPRAKIMFCNADLHFLRELRAMMAKNDPSLMSSVVEIRDAELDVIRRADVTLSYSETEHAVIASHNLNTGRVMTAPWVAEIVEDAPPFAARSGLSFLGGFGHPPNLEAVEHFIRDVMPALRTAAPGICLSVYGSRAPESLLNLKRDGIHVAGYVENVREAYDRARVFVAPLLSGAGVKGKVVGAMAHGVPCVLSPVAAEGIGVRHGHDCLIAETAPEWVAAVLSLHEDEALWRRIASNAREHVRQSYSFERGRRLMRRALEAVGVFAPEEPDGLYCRSASPPPP